MRRTIVFLSLLGMLGTVAGMGALRERELLQAEPPAVESASTEAGAVSGSVGEAEAGAAARPEAKAGGGVEGGAGIDAGAGTEAPAPATEPSTPPVDPEVPRPHLRVVALGWEVLAPGVLANDGMEPGQDSAFAAAGLDVSFSSVVDAEEIEIRLGRGGADERGADVALVPLPAFVASYERLRALSPQVFHVVAWSRGRDVLVGEGEVLQQPPRGELRLHGEPGSSSVLLGLFALEQAGVSPSRVRLVEGGSPGRRHGLQAVERRKSREIDARDLVLSTAEATHLVPVVAVAPAGVVARREADLVTWSRVWLDGATTLGGDPAAAARTLASESGAPEAVDLIDGLGWLDFTDLHGAAQAAGLSGRGAVELDGLFHRTWSLWRDVGLLTTPPPEHVPLTAIVIADLAREVPPGPAPVSPAIHRDPSGDEPGVLLTHTVSGRRLSAAAESRLVAEVGFLAGVFSRSTIEVTVPRSSEAADRVATHASERFGLGEGRVVVVPAEPEPKGTRPKKPRVAATVVVRDAR